MKLSRLPLMFAIALSMMSCSISVPTSSSEVLSSLEGSSSIDTAEESTEELTSESIQETTEELTSESIQETTEDNAPELELLSFGIPFVDSPSARHLGPRMPHRHSRQTGQTIYLSENENVPLVAQVRNNNRLIFMDIVVWSEALKTLCVFNEGHGKYQCSSTTERHGTEWVTDIVLDVNYSLINLDTENCEDSKEFEIREITFLSVTDQQSHPNLTDSSVAKVTFRYDNEVSPIGHDWGEWAIVTEPTCAAEGLERRICKNNPDHIEERAIAKVAHEYGDDQVCANCGALYSWEYLAYKYVSAYDGYEVTGPASKEYRSSLDKVIIPDTYQDKKVCIVGPGVFNNWTAITSLDFGNSVSIIMGNTLNCPDMVSCVLPDALEHCVLSFNIHESAFNVYENGRYLGSSDNPYLYFDSFIDTDATEIIFAKECRFAPSWFPDFGGMKLDTITKISLPDTPHFGYTSSGSNSILPDELCTIVDGSKYLGNDDNPTTSLVALGAGSTISETCTSIGGGLSHGYYGNPEPVDEPFVIPESVEYMGSIPAIQGSKTVVFPETCLIPAFEMGYEINLESVDAPRGTLSLSSWAFQSCVALSSLSLPKSLLYIGEWCFFGCKKLTSITYEGTMMEWEAIEKPDKWYETYMGEWTYEEPRPMISAVVCSDGTVTNPPIASSN